MKSRSLFISLGLIGALAACQSKTEAPAPAKKAEAVAEPAKAEPAQAAAQTKADPACVGAAGEGAGGRRLRERRPAASGAAGRPSIGLCRKFCSLLGEKVSRHG